MFEKLKKSVCKANLELQKQKLVIYSWGNVSGIDRKTDVVAIKPSGIDYRDLTPDKIVLLDLKGNIIEGKLKPSSDTPTHLEIYKNFPQIGGVCHTHSTYATMWAQACRQIPPLGTTGADYFYGAVPVTKALTKSQIKKDYELNTGKVIVQRFKKIDPLIMPACLVACHGPFTWAATPEKAVENAVILENTAKLAFGTVLLNLDILPISKNLLDKHFFRKHGKNAYYGQKT
ncbi:MAG: L-ribulose-5-phosphate 4-epimerase [Planctomycetes bacterium ADurb.Bin401]|nr:MAG: L-ribulose-5-phosphate 4-epimerase [Planctomycetes bacterium ADurb.Bin401]